MGNRYDGLIGLASRLGFDDDVQHWRAERDREATSGYGDGNATPTYDQIVDAAAAALDPFAFDPTEWVPEHEERRQAQMDAARDSVRTVLDTVATLTASPTPRRDGS